MASPAASSSMASSKGRPAPTSQDWLVQVPISELVKLQAQPEEIARLRTEIEGLRNMYFELLEKFADVRRELRKG